jgi:hypothetical protein
MDKKIKVLYIAGEGRSGSTLLGRMLGELPGFLMCGETIVLWTHNWGMTKTTDACACGVPIEECEIWGDVITETRLDVSDHNEISEESRAFFQRSRFSSLNEILRPGKAIRPTADFSSKIVQLYRSLCQKTGNDIIVDTSKTPALALILSQIDEIDLRVIHLVRDSRGVAFSWTKKITRTDVGSKQVKMRRVHPVISALHWDLSQYIVPRIRVRGRPVLRVRYEDLVSAPSESLTEILRFADEPPSPRSLDFVHEDAVYLQAGHSLMGNPNRVRQGWIELRRDDAWRREMPKFQQFLVTTFSFPYLLRHRYLFRRNHKDAA